MRRIYLATELSREEFFKRFQSSGSVDDLLDPSVRKLVDKGFLVVKDESGKVFKTKGSRLLREGK